MVTGSYGYTYTGSYSYTCSGSRLLVAMVTLGLGSIVLKNT